MQSLVITLGDNVFLENFVPHAKLQCSSSDRDATTTQQQS